MKRPDKVSDVIDAVHLAIRTGNYLDTRHAFERREERRIGRDEVIFVLLHGRHEKAKDVFRENWKNWAYAIRGKTLDSRELRIVVAFDPAGMLIITAIDLEL